MKKIQPKIFIDITTELNGGDYTLNNGYSIGQVIHFNDTGEEYLHKTDGVWVNAINGMWENSTIQQKQIKYGRLYNWYAATDTRGIAPVGWHVPTDIEWNILLTFIGNDATQSAKLISIIDGGLDIYQFNARLNGYYDGGFNYKGTFAEIWGNKSNGVSGAFGIYMYIGQAINSSNNYSMASGRGIRLLKDNSINEGDVIIDGDTYHSVTIGNQVWLQQNLAVTHYQNGDPILSNFSGTLGAVTAYNNDESNVYDIIVVEDLTHIQPINDKKIHASIIDDLPTLWENSPSMDTKNITNGRLYNFYAASDTRGIAPIGWHVPTMDEFTTLINFCGGVNVAGSALKESGTTHWVAPNNVATNQFGFDLLPSGIHDTYYDNYSSYGSTTFLWTSIQFDNDYAYYANIGTWSGYISLYQTQKSTGASIRCIRDNGNTETTVSDIDGNKYTSVTIGTQTWLVENLATTKYNNGDPILQIFNTTDGAYGNYNNDESYVYNIVSIEDKIHIIPTNEKRVPSNIIDGLEDNVKGPTGSVMNNFPTFTDDSGKLLKDSGLNVQGIVDLIEQSKWVDVPPVLGTTLEGGKVGYVFSPHDPGYDKNLWKGIIIGTPSASPMNFSPNITNGVTSMNIGDGYSNTLSVISAIGSDATAANYVVSLTNGGYSDWFIPSATELQDLESGLKISEVYGNFYSSSESDPDYQIGVSWTGSDFGWTGLMKTPPLPITFENPSSQVLPCRYFSIPRVYIKPKNDKRIHADFIDGLTNGESLWEKYDNSVEAGIKYGYLYNQKAINDIRLISPIGYHIPTTDEFNILIQNVGGNDIAGGVLKESGTTHWDIQLENITPSGFNALPGGIKLINSFTGLNSLSVLLTQNSAFSITDNSNSISIFDPLQMDTETKLTDLLASVRCIKDNNDLATSEILDYDGNVYHEIKLGNQIWLIENLATSHYNNGDLIGADKELQPNEFTFTQQSSISDIVSFDNTIIISDGTGNIYTSINLGSSFTKTRNSLGSETIYSGCYGNNTVIFVGNNGLVIQSIDGGMIWTSGLGALNISNNYSGYSWNGVTYGNGLYLAVSSGGPTGGLIMKSTDGFIWDLVNIGDNNSWSSVIYNEGKFHASGGGCYMNSSDGINWNTVISIQVGGYLIAEGNNIVIIMNNGGPSMNVSINGGESFTYYPNNSILGYNWAGLNYLNGKFLLTTTGAGPGNMMFSSSDGITWIPISNINHYYNATCVNNDSLVCVGAGVIGIYTINNDNYSAYDNNNSYVRVLGVTDAGIRPIDNELLDYKYIKNVQKVNNSITTTYSELLNLKLNSNLLSGVNYIISDYQTVHKIPNTNDTNIGIIEPLEVLAIDINLLSPIAYSLTYPQDIIYYNIENNQQVVSGCTKGYIYRRIDTFQNNDIPFDFRNVKFRRWQIDVTNIWDSEVEYNINEVVLYSGTNDIYICINDNITSVNPSEDNNNSWIYNGSNWKLFEWSNLNYVSVNSENWKINDDTIISCSTNYTDYNIWGDLESYKNSIYNNKINSLYISGDIIKNNNSVIFGSNIYNNIIGGNFFDNTIGSYFTDNIIGGNFKYNSIGTCFQDNSIGNYFNNNSIGTYFQANTIESYFSINIIGSNSNSNSIGSNSYYNIIGNYFRLNIIEGDFQDNIIRSSFHSNIIGSNSHSNIIGSDFYSNIIGIDFNSNTIGSQFYYNTIGGQFNYNTIGSQFYYNTIGSHFTMNNVCDNFNIMTLGIDFTSATHVYNQYTKELFVNSDYTQRLIYDKMTIVDANA